MTTAITHTDTLANYRAWFDVEQTDDAIYVTCARATSYTEMDYIVSLEAVRTDEDTSAEDFAIDEGLLTEEDAEDAAVTVWVADDPHTRECFATRDEAMIAFTEMMDLYIDSAGDLSDTLADAAGDHDWIAEGVDAADITSERQAREAVTETIVVALTVAHDYSEAFARYVVAQNPRFIAGLVADVMTEVYKREVANVVTTPEAADMLGIKPESVQQNCRRGVYKTARQSGGIWLIHRDEVEALGQRL